MCQAASQRPSTRLRKPLAPRDSSSWPLIAQMGTTFQWDVLLRAGRRTSPTKTGRMCASPSAAPAMPGRLRGVRRSASEFILGGQTYARASANHHGPAWIQQLGHHRGTTRRPPDRSGARRPPFAVPLLRARARRDGLGRDGRLLPTLVTTLFDRFQRPSCHKTLSRCLSSNVPRPSGGRQFASDRATPGSLSTGVRAMRPSRSPRVGTTTCSRRCPGST